MDNLGRNNAPDDGRGRDGETGGTDPGTTRSRRSQTVGAHQGVGRWSPLTGGD